MPIQMFPITMIPLVNPLISAVRKRKLKLVKKAIVAGSSLEERDSEGNTALCVAAEMGLDEIVSLLLDHGAYVNAENHEGRTALHLAAIGGVKSIVKKLLLKNASPFATDGSGSTPLELALIKKRKEVQELLTTAFLNGVNNCESAGFGMTPPLLTVNVQSVNTIGQTVGNKVCVFEKTSPQPHSNAVEMSLPPSEPLQSQYPEEPIKSEDILSKIRNIAYMKKQTLLIRLALHRARERRFCKLQERRNYHAAKNYKILLKKHRVRKQIQRDRIRRRAGFMKRMRIVPPTHQNSTQRKIEHAVERAIKSGGRRAAYNAKKRATQFESHVVAALQKKRQDRWATRTKKRQDRWATRTKKNKKRKLAVRPSFGNVPSESEQSHRKPCPSEPCPGRKQANSSVSGKAATSKQKKKTLGTDLECHSTFAHKPIVTLESKQTDILEMKTIEKATYASLFPMSHVKEFPTFELAKSDKKTQRKSKKKSKKSEKNTQKKDNLSMTTFEENKYEGRIIMKILIEDLLAAARERNNRKNCKKFMKKYKKKLKSFNRQREKDYWIPNVQITDKIVTDFECSGSSSCTTTKMRLVASESCIEDVSMQLNHNVDVSTLGINDTTPIHIAVRKKNEKDLTRLLNAGATVDTRDKYGRTPLHEAALRGLTQCVRVLLQFGSNVDAKEDKFGSSPLHLASLRCQNECVKTLVEGGADILITDTRGQTPLHVCAWNGHAACIDTLIDLGTPVDIPCNDGPKRTALHLAATNGHLECISILLEKGAAVNSVDGGKISALLLASRAGQANCVRLLLQNGANVNLKSGNNDTALHMAAFSGSEECVSVLLESGARVDFQGRHLRTALHVSAERGHHKCVHLLLDSGASVQSADRFKNTPLHLAAERNHVEVVRLLVDAGASRSAKNNKRKTPWDVAGGDGVRSLLV